LNGASVGSSSTTYTNAALANNDLVTVVMTADNMCQIGSPATSSAITMTVNPNITPTFTAVSAICTGASLSALPTTSNNGYTGTWSPALNNTATTIYTFTPTAGLCATTTTMTITVNPLPTASITAGGATTFCSGGNVGLTASGGSTYSWRNGSTPVGTSASLYTASTAGSYTVIATDVNGCVSAASSAIAVTVNSLPTPVITASTSTDLCSGGSVVLTASGGSVYFWNNGANSSSITVSTAGSYTVTSIDDNFCSGTSSATVVTVTPYVASSVSIAASATTIVQELV
jgi:hypothetical protein